MPQHLTELTPATRPRGPAPAAPSLSVDERARFFDHLRVIAERGTGPSEALMRRQAVYLLGFDGRPEVVDWLRAEWSRAGRRRLDREDITGLLEARSASVALAVAGDSTKLHDFVDHTAEGRADVANLPNTPEWATYSPVQRQLLGGAGDGSGDHAWGHYPETTTLYGELKRQGLLDSSVPALIP